MCEFGLLNKAWNTPYICTEYKQYLPQLFFTMYCMDVASTELNSYFQFQLKHSGMVKTTWAIYILVYLWEARICFFEVFLGIFKGPIIEVQLEILQKYESAVFHGLGINSISAWNHKFLWKYQDYLLWISTFSYSGKKHWLENCKSLRIYITTAEAQSINGLPLLSFIPKINPRWDLLKSKYISTTSLVRLRLNSKELLLNWPCACLNSCFS